MNVLMKYRGFVEAVKTGSISAAAEALNYSQSGVSHMIGSLEQEFGFPLLNRAKSGVVLTDAGRQIYALCVQLLEKQEQIDDAAQQLNGTVTGTIRVGAYYSVLMNWFPTIVEHVAARYPQLELQIVEGNAEELFGMMRHNAIDVGILSSSAPEDFSFTPLHRDPVVAIVPKGHPLAARDRLEIADLAPYPFLVKPEHAQGILKELLEAQTFQTSSSYSVRSDNAMLGLVSRGFGIGVVGEMVARASSDVEYRRFRQDYFRTIGIAVPDWKPQTGALRSFIGIVRELYGDAELFSEKTGLAL